MKNSERRGQVDWSWNASYVLWANGIIILDQSALVSYGFAEMVEIDENK